MRIDLIGSVTSIGTSGGEINKTKILFDYLSINHFVRLLDYEKFRGLRKIVLPFYIIMLLVDSKSDLVVVSKSFSSARIINFIIWFFNFRKKSIRYFIVGTSIHRIKKNKLYVKILADFEYVYSETKEQMRGLIGLGISAKYIPNWKLIKFANHDFISYYITNKSKGLKLLYFSRICLEKGYRELIEAVVFLVENGVDVSLYLYGEIDHLEQTYIQSVIKKKSYIFLMGTITLDSVSAYEELAGFDFMVMPTKHSGEGVPGAIIDCFLAGVPVIITDNSSNREIIQNSINGFLYDASEKKNLIEQLIFVSLMDKESMISLRSACCNSVSRFNIEKLLKDEFND